MTSNLAFLDRFDIVEAFPTVDLQTGANTGDWISLKNARRAVVVFTSGVGTAGDDPTVTLLQATDVAGTGSKALNINTAHVHKKQAATSQAAVTAFADASAGVTNNAWTDADAAEQSLTLVIEVNPSDLDVANGFDCISALKYIVEKIYADAPADQAGHLGN